MHVMLAVACGFCAAAAQAALVCDYATRGDWLGVYGATGYVLFDYNRAGSGINNTPATAVNDLAALPAWITYGYGGGVSQYIWTDNTGDTRAPQNPAAPGGTRKAATSYSNGDWQLTFTLAQPAELKVGLYALDWDYYAAPTDGRHVSLEIDGNGEIADISNAAAAAPYDGHYYSGTWALFSRAFAAGTHTLQVRQLAGGGSNATLSALTFDPVPEPTACALLAGAASLALSRRHRRRPRSRE